MVEIPANTRELDEKRLYPYVRKWLFLSYNGRIKTIIEDYEIPSSNCWVDFYCELHDGYVILVEVKKEQVRIKDMEQLMKYFVHARERYGDYSKFRLVVVPLVCYDARKEILGNMGIEIVFWETIKRICEGELNPFPRMVREEL